MGVGQGSVMGNVLFITYINDMLYVLRDCTLVILFADDTILKNIF